MKEYLVGVPEYIARCFRWIDFVLGGLLLIFYLYAAEQFGLSKHETKIATLVLAVFVLAQAGYTVYHEERQMRAAREARTRLSARPSSWAWNMPDPGPERVSLKAAVQWEIWTDVDLQTAEFGMNIIGVRSRRWWRPWRLLRPGRQALFALPAKGQDSFVFRRSFRAIDPQPIHGIVEFEYECPFRWEKDGGWDYELFIEIGSPSATLRAPVESDVHERGSRRPH